MRHGRLRRGESPGPRADLRAQRDCAQQLQGSRRGVCGALLCGRARLRPGARSRATSGSIRMRSRYRPVSALMPDKILSRCAGSSSSRCQPPATRGAHRTARSPRRVQSTPRIDEIAGRRVSGCRAMMRTRRSTRTVAAGEALERRSRLTRRQWTGASRESESSIHAIVSRRPEEVRPERRASPRTTTSQVGVRSTTCSRTFGCRQAEPGGAAMSDVISTLTPGVGHERAQTTSTSRPRGPAT